MFASCSLLNNLYIHAHSTAARSNEIAYSPLVKAVLSRNFKYNSDTVQMIQPDKAMTKSGDNGNEPNGHRITVPLCAGLFTGLTAGCIISIIRI